MKKIIPLKCPECGARIIDEVEGCKTELIAKKKLPVGWTPDYVQKCQRCKQEIGIRKVV